MKTEFPNLTAMHRTSCEKFGPRPAIRYKKDCTWHEITWTDYRSYADYLGAGLIEIGVKPGDRVAILSENRWEWLVADHAILTAGAADVPIHSPSTAAQIQYQLEHSGACGIVVSTNDQWAKVASILDQVPSLKFAILIDARPESSPIPTYTWDGLRQLGVRAGAKGRQEIDARQAKINDDSLATIIYTSGTTSRPKGVMLSHGNLLTNAVASVIVNGANSSDVIMNWLPLSHVFARLSDHYTSTLTGMTMGLAQSANTVLDDVKEIQPSYFTTVPRLMEKAWAVLMAQPQADRVALARKMFGRRLKNMTSGGGPLPPHIAYDFKDLGLLIYEGYGLTETSPIISVNREGHWKIGTVGRAIIDVEVKIADDGEIITRGPHVMQGYWRDPEATKAAIKDGWFYTGDLGSLDEDGYLKITGRKKDLIVTAGGKNIAPAAIEALLVQDDFIEQAIAHGDARPFVSAIIVPRFEKIDEAIRQSGGAFTHDGGVVTDKKLKDWFQGRVNQALKDLSNVERVKKIVLLSRPLSLDQDEVTVTQKVRRTAVFNRFQSQLDALYQGAAE